MSAAVLTLERRAPRSMAAGLWVFATVAIALGAARAVTTTYVPVLLERIADRPGLIGAVMLVNAAAGFAIPLATGLWSDRRGTRGPFILGGTVLSAGGLIAIALGTASSYAVLALAAATVYIGLNAASTAHRALVAERFTQDRRAAATSAQEGAMLVGALMGTVVGGALIDASASAMFLLWAVLLPLLALPTLAWQRTSQPARVAEPEQAERVPARKLLLEVLHRDGARQVLIAQVLWVASYTALTPFMVLYAEEVLGLRAAAAGVLLAGFGLLTGAGMVWGGRLEAERLRGALLAGVALLGGGLLTAMAASNVLQAALPFAAAALGAGIVSAVGFPYFTRFVPDGQAGRYAGAFFSARAIATTAALPAAGLLIAATGSYRALLAMGAVGLAGLVPLARAERRREPVALATPLLPPVTRLAAVIPVHRSDRAAEVAAGALRHADHVVLVDDGAPPELAAELERAARHDRVQLVRMGSNQGKGTAVVAGVEAALAGSADAVIVLDADGQHPPELIPRFLEAADRSEVAIGSRPRDEIMPPLRRIANTASTWTLSLILRRRVRDSQNGMRLFRASALRAVPHSPGRYEAETRHLKALIRSGRDIAWVPMPAIYGGEASSFRPVADTLRVMRAALAPVRPAAPAPTRADGGAPAREPGKREARLVLGAAALSLAGLAGWATVIVPHAEREVELGASTMAIALGSAALLAAGAMRTAARLAPARRLPALLIGVLALGGGMLSSTVGVTAPGLLTSLAPVAIGLGLVAVAAATVLAGLAPPAQRGRRVAAQLAVVTGAAAAGVLLALAAGGDGYRTVFALAGGAALAAVVPLLRVEGTASPALVRSVGARAARFAAGTGALLALAALIHTTILVEVDKAVFEFFHGLGATPEVVESLLVEPSLRNYVVIAIVASLVGARYWGRTTPGRTLLLVAGTGIVAYAGVRTCWALWERPRPEEVLGIDPGNGHSWAAYPSFPSGHVAVTTALALAIAALVPKLRYVLWTYAVLIAFTRLAYGAHFPSDVLLGFVLGWLAVRTTIPRPLLGRPERT